MTNSLDDSKSTSSDKQNVTTISPGSYRRSLVTSQTSGKSRNIAVMAREIEKDKKQIVDTEQNLSEIETVCESVSPIACHDRTDCRSPVPSHKYRHTDSPPSRRTVSPFSSRRGPPSSPPPKRTSPIPREESFPPYRSSTPVPPSPARSFTPLPPLSSPPPRRLSTPLYVVSPPPSPIPGKSTRPVMMRMATVCVTSPVLNRRSVSPLPSVHLSTDDTKCDYSSQGGRKVFVENDIRDTVRLQKLFRKLQRQVHSPEHQTYYPWPNENCVELWRQERYQEEIDTQSRRGSFVGEERIGRGREGSLVERPNLLQVDISAPRRSTLASIGRSVTICDSEQGQRTAEVKRETFRRTYSEAKGEQECSIEFEVEDLSSPQGGLERPTTLPELNSRPASRVLDRPFVSPVEGEAERLKRKRATAIVTSGALTFMILAAALVTASFLMSPVIEDVFVNRLINRTVEFHNGSHMDGLSVHQRSQLPLPPHPSKPGSL